MELPWGVEQPPSVLLHKSSLAAGEQKVMLSAKVKVTAAESLLLAKGELVLHVTNWLVIS